MFICLMPPLPPLVTHMHIPCSFSHIWKGGGWGEDNSENVRGGLVHKRVENTNMTDCISSLQTLLNTSKDNFFFFEYVEWGIKNPSFRTDVTNVHITLVKSAHTKSFSQKNYFTS